MSELMTTTYSMWRLFRNCRMACKWRYIDELVPLERDPNLAFGSVIHDCLECWHGERDLAKVLDHIDRTYPNRAQDDHQQADWHLARAIMSAYAEHYPAEAFEVVALEKTSRLANSLRGSPPIACARLTHGWPRGNLHGARWSMREIAIEPASKRRHVEGWETRQRGFIPVLFGFTIPTDATPDQIYREAFIAMLSYSYEPQETSRLVVEAYIPMKMWSRENQTEKYAHLPKAINRAANCADISFVTKWGSTPGEIAVVVTEAPAQPERTQSKRSKKNGR